LGDFLQHLDLEEAADDQDADQHGEAALGVEGALLDGVAGDGFVGGADIGDVQRAVATILAILPGSNCGACGSASCHNLPSG
jgi:ArsR family metal-binding transcriptional regulator